MNTPEYQINDRLSFMRFLGLGIKDKVPDAKTIWLFKERLIDLKFLKKLNKETDRTKVLHVIIDNYAAHKTKEVLEYVENSKGRIVLHFIPTHSSWLNLVERWFAELTSKRIRRESWASVQELEEGIMNFIRNWNETGKKYVWVKTASQIRTSINEAKKRYTDCIK